VSVKIFGFEIRKFEANNTTVQMVETWCVKWSSLHKDIIDKGEQVTNVQGFPTQDGAEAYAKELTDARRLLGDRGFPVKVYRQSTPTNAN
jgi:hypothetical protein